MLGTPLTRRRHIAKTDALLGKLGNQPAAIVLHPGDFLILFPQDARMPGCHAHKPSSVKKLSGKSEYISGTTASGLFEARLGKEEMGKEKYAQQIQVYVCPKKAVIIADPCVSVFNSIYNDLLLHTGNTTGGKH